jgi:hypothetical protein
MIKISSAIITLRQEECLVCILDSWKDIQMNHALLTTKIGMMCNKLLQLYSIFNNDKSMSRLSVRTKSNTINNI